MTLPLTPVPPGSLPLNTWGDAKIRLLADGSPLQPSDVFVVERGTHDYKIPASAISAISPVFNVASYGAKGDGVTDDTAAIDAASAALAAAGGGEIIYRAGTYIATGVTRRTGVRHRGAGLFATTLQQKANTTGDFITGATTVDLDGFNDMTIDGNKANQSAANNGVYIANANPQASYYLLDPFFEMTNVVVRNFKGAGIYLTGARGAARLTRVGAQFNELQGFYIDSGDHWFTNCWAGSNYYAGFHQTVNGSVCEFVGCKAWTNGAKPSLLLTDIGAGFYAASAINTTMNSCQANGNSGHGFQLASVKNFDLAGCNAGGNGAAASYAGAGAGFYVKTPGVVSIHGESYNYPGQTSQAYGLFLESPNGSNCRYNILFGTGSAANGVAPIGGTNGVDALLNQTFQQARGLQRITYAATVTPDPTLGETVVVTLTGALTLANPSQEWTGARLTLVLIQDGVGGRVTSFGTHYKTNWTPDTTASKTNTISFVCNNGTWYQTTTATGL